MAQLIEQHRGQVDVAVSQRLLSDHRNAPQSICAHPRKGVEPTGTTLASMVFQPAQGAIHIAYGNGCQVPYHRYTFDP